MIRTLSLVIMISSVALVNADDCKRVRTVYPTYTAPTYNQTYTPTITLVPKVIEVETNRDHYYSLDSYYQQNLLADAIVGRLLQLQKKEESKPNLAPMSRASEPVSLAPSTGNASTYQNKELATVLKNSCVKCHNGSTKQALLTSDDKLLNLPKNYVLNIYHQVNTGRMPKSAQPLEDKFLPMIDEWVSASR